MHPEIRLALQVEHQVEVFFARSVATIEVDRSYRAAGNDAPAMSLAAIEVDLVAPVDGSFRTSFDARVAARAQVEIDRIFLDPRDVERAKPSRDAFHIARIDRVVALLRQLVTYGAAGDEHRDRQLVRQRVGPVQGHVGGADDQQLTLGLECHARNRIGFGQRGRG